MMTHYAFKLTWNCEGEISTEYGVTAATSIREALTNIIDDDEGLFNIEIAPVDEGPYLELSKSMYEELIYGDDTKM